LPGSLYLWIFWILCMRSSTLQRKTIGWSLNHQPSRVYFTNLVCLLPTHNLVILSFRRASSQVCFLQRNRGAPTDESSCIQVELRSVWSSRERLPGGLESLHRVQMQECAPHCVSFILLDTIHTDHLLMFSASVFTQQVLIWKWNQYASNMESFDRYKHSMITWMLLVDVYRFGV